MFVRFHCDPPRNKPVQCGAMCGLRGSQMSFHVPLEDSQTGSGL